MSMSYVDTGSTSADCEREPIRVPGSIQPHGVLMALDPISLVCKLMTVEGRPAVKLSDNARKATGPQQEIARYRSVFGSVAVEGAVVTV